MVLIYRAILLCVALTVSAQANETPVSQIHLPQAGNYPLGQGLEYIEDPSRELGLVDALVASQWQQNDQTDVNFGFSHSAYWLRTELVSPQSNWALWLQYTQLDSVMLWLCPLPVDSLQCQQQQTGDTQPIDEHRLSYPSIIFPLDLKPNTPYLLLLRVQTQGAYQLPLSVIDSQTLETELISRNFWRGLYYATLLVMGLYNFIIFLTIGKRNYWHFTAFVASLLFLHMVYDGSAFQFLWPQEPLFNQYALPIALALNVLSMSFLVPSFLRLEQLNSGIFRLFRVYSALSLVSLMMLPLVSYDFLVRVFSGLSLVVVASALWVGLTFWLRGVGATRFFTLAWGVVLLGMLWADLRFLNWLSHELLSVQAYQLSTLFGVLCLSLALGERTVYRQKEQLAEKTRQLDEQKYSIEYLRQYQDIYQNSLTGKFQLDAEGYFTRSNASWRAILGYNDESFFLSDNPKFNSLFHDSKQRRKFWRDLKEQGKLRARVLTFIQPINGERVVVSISMRKGSGGQATWYGAGQDVTENYLKEQAMIQLQQDKTQSLRQLVIGISQEMNTPLSNIRLAGSFLEGEHPDWNEEDYNKHLKEHLLFMHQGSERLYELNSLMKSAIIQPNQYLSDELDLRQWLALWQDSHLKEHENLKLRCAVHSYLIRWQTYPDALRTVLDQLLDISCQRNSALLEKGELKITVDFRERNDFLELHYQDNGNALDQEQRNSIFMPFLLSNTGSRRNDLGLYQSYNLITELLQGFIEWPEESEEFYLLVRFNLPIAAEKGEKMPKAEESKPNSEK